MDMTGEFRIPAPRQRVWEGLNDPQVLKGAIPGCDTITKVSDTEFTAKVVAKVGPVKATFNGKVTLTDLDPPNSYTITGEGTGGVAGFAKGSAKVDLREEGAETVLSYAAQAHVGGKLAQIGSRLIDATARKMAEQFFSRFVGSVAPEQAAGAGGSPPAEPTARTAATAEPEVSAGAAAMAAASDRARLPPAVWVTGLVAIVGAMLWAFTHHGGGR